MHLGEKLLYLRKTKGISQEQLAAQITVSRQAISKWELGESQPDTDNVKQLAKLFDVTTDFLLDDDVDIPIGSALVNENEDATLAMLKNELSSDEPDKLAFAAYKEQVKKNGKAPWYIMGIGIAFIIALIVVYYLLIK